MEDYEATEPQLESFRPDEKERVILNNYHLTYSNWKRMLKRILCFVVIGVMIAVTLYLIYILFKFKAKKAREFLATGNYNYWPMIIGSLNGVQIKVMSVIYSKLMSLFNDWENYEKQSQFDSSLTIKIILFEFINNYSALFYIAFFKAEIEGCVNNECEAELRLQTYMILATTFALNAVEIGVPFAMMAVRKYLYLKGLYIVEEEKKEITFEPHTVRQQLVADQYDGQMYEYNEIVIMFGYVVFFSICCPLTPLIVFFLLLTEKVVDSYKLFYLLKVNSIAGCKGIGVYNSILTVIYFLGMMFSLCEIIFTRPYLAKTDLWIKFFILFIFQSILLISIYYFHWHVLPKWYESRESIGDKFTSSYYNVDDDKLLHKQFLVENNKEQTEDTDPITQLKLEEEFNENKDKDIVEFDADDVGYDSFDESNEKLNKFFRVRKQFKPLE